jgi:hypothetical protein
MRGGTGSPSANAYDVTNSEPMTIAGIETRTARFVGVQRSSRRLTRPWVWPPAGRIRGRMVHYCHRGSPNERPASTASPRCRAEACGAKSAASSSRSPCRIGSRHQGPESRGRCGAPRGFSSPSQVKTRAMLTLVAGSTSSMSPIRQYSREDGELWRYRAVRVLWHQSGALPCLVRSLSLPGANGG